MVRLIDVLTTEIGNHHDHYKSYITGDWKQDLIDFKLNQKFDSDIVDLLLYTLYVNFLLCCWYRWCQWRCSNKSSSSNPTKCCCCKGNFYFKDRPTLWSDCWRQIQAFLVSKKCRQPWQGSSLAIPATGNAIPHGKRQFLFTSKSGDIGETSSQSSVQSPPCQMENSCGKVRSQATTAKHLTEREDKQQRHMKRIKCSVWDGVLVKNVHALPYDIDGNCIYQLPYSKNDRLASSRDGRPWRI